MLSSVLCWHEDVRPFCLQEPIFSLSICFHVHATLLFCSIYSFFHYLCVSLSFFCWPFPEPRLVFLWNLHTEYFFLHLLRTLWTLESPLRAHIKSSYRASIIAGDKLHANIYIFLHCLCVLQINTLNAVANVSYLHGVHVVSLNNLDALAY